MINTNNINATKDATVKTRGFLTISVNAQTSIKSIFSSETLHAHSFNNFSTTTKHIAKINHF